MQQQLDALQEERKQQLAVMQQQQQQLDALQEERKQQQEERKQELDVMQQQLLQLDALQFRVLQQQATEAFAAVAVDPICRAWDYGSRNTSRKSDSSEERVRRESRRAVRKQLCLNLYGTEECEVKCALCGAGDGQRRITSAHIIPEGASSDEAVWHRLNSPLYKEKFDARSPRNYLFLCGRQGDQGSCHHLFDAHAFLFKLDGDLAKPRLKVHAVKAAANHLDGTLLPVEYNPYKRALAAHAKNTLRRQAPGMEETLRDSLTECVKFSDESSQKRPVDAEPTEETESARDAGSESMLLPPGDGASHGPDGQTCAETSPVESVGPPSVGNCT